MGAECKPGKAKERKLSYKGERATGRDCYKWKVHWRKWRAQGIVDFHWLRRDSLSLAELLPGKEKLFLLMAIAE